MARPVGGMRDTRATGRAMDTRLFVLAIVAASWWGCGDDETAERKCGAICEHVTNCPQHGCTCKDGSWQYTSSCTVDQCCGNESETCTLACGSHGGWP